jgi:Bacteriocin-protection, YdeI or OmpD-Associated/Domain of unknown function (DUF1905)
MAEPVSRDAGQSAAAAGSPRVTFRATVVQAGKTATGIEVPVDIVARLGTGKRPPVRVTINGHTYRSTVAVMGGAFMIPVSAENRKSAGIAGGEEVAVELELDAGPREVVVPADFAEALDHDPSAKRRFDSLSYSHQRAHVLAVEGAKAPETRQRRIAKAVATLHDEAAS